MKTAVVFGSGHCSPRSKLYKDAMSLGEILARKGYNIANGGYAGVMESSAKGAAKFNVERIGVVFRNYKSQPNPYLTKIIEARSYLDRLEKLITIGDLFIVFEGGSGTLLELVSLLALKDRNLKTALVICIGEKWRKVLRCLAEELKIEIENHLVLVEKVDYVNTIL